MNNQSKGLAFLPLGGTGEIGMNFNLYRMDGQWLIVDCGIGFSGNNTPEADILVPDSSFIEGYRDDLCGMVITHAHEDHIGAVAHLWKGLGCPIYATPFAAAVLKKKLYEAQLLSKITIHIIPPGSQFSVGPFDIEFVPVAHSIPESQSLIMRTPYGTIVHTGDWKIDPTPLIGPVTDMERFKAVGQEGVLALIGDSTNVLTDRDSDSELSVRESLAKIISNLQGRVAVTCFASNVARIESIAIAAQEANRKVVIVGRSLKNIDGSARECGYLKDIPPFLTEQQVNSLSDHETLMIITGSQGEPRSALSRIAADTHQNISLGVGDTVIYSSRMIPGNEQAVIRVQDLLARRGVKIITDRDDLVHVSGHATRRDMHKLYEAIKPQYIIPVHGEWRHLSSHATLAKEHGAQAILLEDGDLLNLSPGEVKVIDTAVTGQLAVDGGRLLPIDGDIMSKRRKMLYNGMIIASLAIDDEGYLIGDPKISAPGLLTKEDPEAERVTESFAVAIENLPEEIRLDDNLLKEASKTALRRAFGNKLQKRPLVDVHLLRV
ncbi:ribonuclease J [Entomobacter blattae]|uniref:Ribonuclease J n=1 Tax=Entomobacter blattae TaxID=2762277 RepID=A0A7H1NSY4_9PROT|nr:ribonuclease J [Entomobacter blattae]QNT78894.1 Ribonuclease J [Entomobacter blattae]